jgi:N-acetylmuramoyl-L-alanine amidase
LIEAGFLSHDGEAGKVASPEYRQQIADAVAAGIQAYIATVRALE